MIIILNDDRAYRSWVAHHHAGFVLDGRRKPKLGHFVLHRATCSQIAPVRSSRRRWTTGGRLKAVSLEREELSAWAADETTSQVAYCGACKADQDPAMPAASASTLPKLARDVLDYVVEAALIHMEHRQPPYQLSLGDIASCFGKTPGQIAPVVRRLIDESWLTWMGKQSAARKPHSMIVAPTMQAMRTLTAFQGESDATIETELEKLQTVSDRSPFGAGGRMAV